MARIQILIRAAEFVAAASIGYVLGEDLALAWILVPAAIALAAFVIDYITSISSTYDRIEGALADAHRFIGPDPSHDVRITLHKPRRFPRKGFKQVCNYVPSGRGRGRLHAKDKGILWKAHAAKARKIESFDDDDAFRAQMINEYNYSEDEMRERTADRRSYICVPIVDNDEVLGLLYLDSSDPKGLPPTGAVERVDLISQLEALMRSSLI